ncbi:hypothetical protein [Exiguobacterium sp. s48]|uniref:hypothetical protein n=1 Tax=Exiguobacterium sp. s48 TaxID=2751273 RepID=UPI001BE90CBA|nr:hypothetical protein [Exiguobacterium sp. s48]
MPLELELIDYDKKSPNESSSKEKKIYSFLNKMVSSAGFVSTRIDTFNESIDQTYYYIKILELLDSPVNEEITNNFIKQTLNKVKEDPSNYIYLDIIKEYKSNSINDIHQMINNDLQQQFTCKNCLTEANPYLIYYGSISTNDAVSAEATKIIGDFILNESDSETLLYYLKWYFDLVNMNAPLHTNHKNIRDIGYEIIDNIDIGNITDSETLYYAFSLSVILHKQFNPDSIIKKINAQKIDYTFDLRVMYYNLKLVELSGDQLEVKTRKSYLQYLYSTQKNATSLYPLVVFEENNLIEMFQWEIIMTHLRAKNISSLTPLLTEHLKNTNLPESQVEIFYQTLLAVEQNIEMPGIKSRNILKKVSGENNITENYYLFQAAYLQGYRLTSHQQSRLKKEINQAFQNNDYRSIMAGIDLDYIFNQDKIHHRKLWNRLQTGIENHQENMTCEEFFMYQMLKNRNGEKIREEEINSFYEMQEIENIVLLKGDYNILSVETMYQYLLLLRLTK